MIYSKQAVLLLYLLQELRVKGYRCTGNQRFFIQQKKILKNATVVLLLSTLLLVVVIGISDSTTEQLQFKSL